MFRVSVDMIVWYFYCLCLEMWHLCWNSSCTGKDTPVLFPRANTAILQQLPRNKFLAYPSYCRYCQKSCWGQRCWQFSLLHLRIVAVPPNPHVFLSHVSADLCSSHLLQRLDELKVTLRGHHFQCLQDHFDWNRAKRNPTIHSKVSKNSHLWVNIWTNALWQICPHSAEEDGIFSALDQKHSK